MHVGFIGLGQMGAGMAASLLRAGHELTAYNRTPERMRPLVERGAHAARTVADACRGDVVITMLADDAAVEAVAFGPSGILASLRESAIHLSTSTISVALAARLAAAHAGAGQRFASAPVFGRPDAAAAGKLFIVAAGASDTLADCASLFDAMGQKTFAFGDEPSAANLVKLSGNFLIASVLESLGEAIALVGKAGLDPRRYLEMLTSTLFTAPLYASYGTRIVERRFEPAGFAARLGEKDLRLALDAAEALRVPMPLASLVRDRLGRLLTEGGEALDWAAVGGLAAEDAGLTDR